MCGIVGAIAERNITPILIEGLKRLEYRGYDSAGVAVFDNEGRLQRCRRVGKVASLEEGLAGTPLLGPPGHRPYPLGDPRGANRRQRPPAFLQRRTGGGAQRHHREPRTSP